MSRARILAALAWIVGAAALFAGVSDVVVGGCLCVGIGLTGGWWRTGRAGELARLLLLAAASGYVLLAFTSTEGQERVADLLVLLGGNLGLIVLGSAPIGPPRWLALGLGELGLLTGAAHLMVGGSVWTVTASASWPLPLWLLATGTWLLRPFNSYAPVPAKSAYESSKSQ